MAMRKPPAELVELFDAALPLAPGVERRVMFGMPAGFVNGNLFCGLFESTVMARLDEAGRADAIAAGGGPFAPGGRPMREYVTLPAEAETDERVLAGWLARALDVVGELPPKAPKPRRKRAAES